MHPLFPSSRLPAMTIVDRQVVHDGFVTLEVVALKTAVHGKPAVIKREVHDHGDGAAVLAFDASRATVVLVRQARAAVLVAGAEPLVIEAIAGIVDDGETPEETARREAMEEAGIVLKNLIFLGAPFTSPGALTERVWLYLGEIDDTAARAAGGGRASEHEEIEILELPVAAAAALLEAGLIADLKTLYLLQALRVRRPELFA